MGNCLGLKREKPAGTEEEARTALTSMGNKSSKQQRLENAAKTGIFNLTEKTLTSFPESALDIPNLRVLHIERCGITSLPSKIEKLSTSLQRLNLPGNKLLSLPLELGRLRFLQVLDCSSNGLTTLPDAFEELNKLKEVNASKNKLEVVPVSLGKANSLRLLDLSSNRISRLPAELGKLANLEDLNVSSNSLAALPQEFGELKRLKRLDASDNKIVSGGIPSSLLKFTPVDHLRIDGNPLKTLQGEDGWEEYASRAKQQELKNVDQRLRTGDLSQGLGSAEEYASMRK
mmetsp:Transcript_6782/g.23847  ORF Transcript_6782/g.23847 Transcript_6782/m.23847 type:complete len:288 (-) Transcript_6782:291-1154(-)